MELLLKNWAIEFHSGIPVYRQIVNRISAAVAQGFLKEGDQLPTIRALQQALNVNPNTIAKAYRELELKGLISAQRGSGCFVAPPRQNPGLSAKEKKTRIQNLLSRLTADAHSQGIHFEDLMDHLQKEGKSHA